MSELDHLIFEIEDRFDRPEESIEICVGRIRQLISEARSMDRALRQKDQWLDELRRENKTLKEENKKVIKPRWK